VKPVRLLLITALALVPATALAQIPVGTRVGTAVVTAGYDDGGRPDPFATLVRPKVGGPTTTTGAVVRNGTLMSFAVADVKCTGVAREGSKYASAILEGPDHTSFVVKPHDRLLDGVVKSIDALGVVIVVHTTDVSGAVEGREIHKLLHPAAEGK